MVYHCAAYQKKICNIRHSFQLLRPLSNLICLCWNLSHWVFAQGQIILESLNENNSHFQEWD